MAQDQLRLSPPSRDAVLAPTPTVGPRPERDAARQENADDESDEGDEGFLITKIATVGNTSTESCINSEFVLLGL